MAIETELKLSIHPENVARLLAHPLLSEGATNQRTLQLRGTYFDTDDHSLHRQKTALRVRREGDRWIQAVKCPFTGTGSIHSRHEWEAEVNSEQPELDKLPEELKQGLFADQQLCDSIKPVFSTDMSRTLWDLQWDDGSHFELCLDQGEVKSHQSSADICEIELELLSGQPAALYQAALELLQTIPLHIALSSKAHKGYGLQAPQPVTFYKAELPQIDKSDTAEAAFIHCVQHCIKHLLINEAVTLIGTEPEGVHQMRVALRRLRCCLKLFKPLIPVSSYNEITPQIMWLSDLLGPVRDWDVFILAMQQIQTSHPEASGLKQILQNAKQQQQRHHDRLVEAIQTEHYTRLFLTLMSWLESRPWRQQLSHSRLQGLDGPIKEFADERLAKFHQRLLEAGGKSPSGLTPEQRHRVRIKSKKFAYSIRFLAALYPQSMDYLEMLSDLRDDLGLLNDIHVARELIEIHHLVNRDGQSAAIISNWHKKQETKALNNLNRHWPVFISQPIFISKAR